MTRYPEFTLAAIQAAPVFFDREASTEKAVRLIEAAIESGGHPRGFFRELAPARTQLHSSPETAHASE